MVMEVVMHGDLNRHMPTGSGGALTVDVLDGITVFDLLAELEIERTEVKAVLVNGAKTHLDQVLSDGDRIGLYPPDWF